MGGLSSKDPFSKVAGVLSDPELARYDRITSPCAQLGFLATRTLARVLLARVSETQARNVVIDETSGKPSLVSNGTLHFNVSHSATYVLVGLARHEVGVDVETVRPFNQSLARRVCDADELQELAHLRGEELSSGLCHMWTVKEACVKAKGVGISFGLRKVHASLVTAGRCGDLSWWSLDIGRPARAAVAVRTSGSEEGLVSRVTTDQLLEQAAI